MGVILTSFLCFSIINRFTSKPVNKTILYLSSDVNEVQLYDDNLVESIKLPRGTEVIIENKEEEYYKINYDNKLLYVKLDNVTENKQDVVKEKERYVRTPVTVYKSINESKILTSLKKGDKVEILNYDKLNNDGSVNMYEIKTTGGSGYVYSKYLVNDYDTSLKNYDEENIYTYHKDRKFSYELYGGLAASLDYYPYEKVSFENNVMPDETRTLYLNGWSGTISNIDSYIELAKKSNINAFVVDIKDGYMAYKSEVAKTYSISNYNSSANSYDNYKEAISKLKNEGFYVIGRITAFNDKNFAKDNPTETIQSSDGTSTGWVSAYSRLAWEFNVELAKEAITEFGFNEIQFDYVRFPELSYSYSKNNYDFKNKYNEEKAQAIQNFLFYATDEIHKLNAYISVDVFGECVGTYVTAYGQYWPAISNIVDVISAMPYPDHFAKGSYGINIPWENPYSLMLGWASSALKRQGEIPTPAKVRTWIQAYDAIRSPYITYDETKISDQIRGLYAAGLTGGYITWNAASSLSKYEAISGAFSKEY